MNNHVKVIGTDQSGEAVRGPQSQPADPFTGLLPCCPPGQPEEFSPLLPV